MSKKTIEFISTIQDVTKECIGLLTHTERLRASGDTKEAYTFAEQNLDILRKLLIANMMYDKTLICVSGLQGAGKTTLMKNFYELDEEYFQPTKGIGEKIPVLITEVAGIQKPAAYATCITKDENGRYEMVEKEVAPGEDYEKASRGNDNTIMYLELKVPYRHTCNSNISFMLLPGFERRNDYLNRLLEFSIHSSDAAVFVFSEQSFASNENAKRIDQIKNDFKENVVYVISGADGSNDGNEQAKKTCIETLQIPESEGDRVICSGSYSDKEKNKIWIDALKKALEKYAYTGENSKLNKNSKYIYDEILKLKDNLYRILEILNDDSNDEMRDFHNASLLKIFDRTKEKKRKELKRNLEEKIDQARTDSHVKLEEEYDKEPKLKYAKRVFFGNSVKDQFSRPREMVKASLYDEQDNLLADQQIVYALGDSLKQWEHPDNSNVRWLIDTEENDQGKQELVAGKNLQAMTEDVTALIQERQKDAKSVELQCENPKKLMGALAEFGTYYFGIESYNNLAEKTQIENYYQPSFTALNPDIIIEGGKSSKHFAAGMLGIMGIDILGDGSLNMISQVAAEFGVALPIAAVASVGIIAAGATSVVSKDINRMRREDCAAAKMTADDIYDQVVKGVLDDYDEYMEKIRERIEGNLDDLGRDGKKITDTYNAKVEINNALQMLDRISMDYMEDAYGLV